MASPLSTQIVNDLTQNFYWSYLSQEEEHSEITTLEISVETFLTYIDIDLDGTEPYNAANMVTMYYGMFPDSLTPGMNYFTYMLCNSVIEIPQGIVCTGILGNSDKFLLLKEGGGYEAIDENEFDTRSQHYKDATVYSSHINELTQIGSLTNHPLSCSFPKEDFKKFIQNNMSSSTMDLSTLILVFKMGATGVSGVDIDYKVQTGIVITKDGTGLRLDSDNYASMPFKNKGLDVGKLCPPSCHF